MLNEVALATGSACTPAKGRSSHMIEALGFGPDQAHSALQISVGRFNTHEQIETAVDLIIETVAKLRKLNQVMDTA